MRVLEWFEQRTQDLLASSGWRVDRDRSSGGALVTTERRRTDLIAKNPDGLRYVIALQVASEARLPLLEGLLATAVLRAEAAARRVNADPLALVCAPSISPRALQRLEGFIRNVGVDTAWGAMDRAGLVVMHGKGLGSISREPKKAARTVADRYRSDLLSDLGQWMLKVVVSHRLPRELQLRSHGARTPIDRGIARTSELAEVAGVSIPTASRFAAAMKRERFVVDGSLRELVRNEMLVDRWRAASLRAPAEIRARWLFARGGPDQLDDLLRASEQAPGDRSCLALFSACARLGFDFVRGVMPHLYLEDVSHESLKRRGLRISEPGEVVDVLIRQPRFPESVFRGATERDGVPVADVIQCWLDVADHPARGEEMAAHLFDRVIRPSLVEESA